MSACIVCLCGLPGAGKTKLAYELYRFPGAQVIVLEYDRLIDNVDNWKSKRKKILEFVKTVDDNVLVVLDDNFYYRSMRYECFSISCEIDASFCQIYVNTDVVQCLKNNLKRCFSIPTDVILRMNSLFEKPDPKNEWEKQTLVVNNLDFDQICTFIRTSWDIKVRKKIQISHPPQVQNELHFADLSLRKYISELLKSDENKSKGKYFAIKKSDVIKKIKNGEIVLPEVTDNVVETYYSFLKNYFDL